MKVSIRERELIQLVERVRPIIYDEQSIHQVKEKGLADFVTPSRSCWPGAGRASSLWGKRRGLSLSAAANPCGFSTPSTAPTT